MCKFVCVRARPNVCNRGCVIVLFVCVCEYISECVLWLSREHACVCAFLCARLTVCNRGCAIVLCMCVYNVCVCVIVGVQFYCLCVCI